MFKRIFIIVMILLFLLTLIGCQKTDQEQGASMDQVFSNEEKDHSESIESDQSTSIETSEQGNNTSNEVQVSDPTQPPTEAVESGDSNVHDTVSDCVSPMTFGSLEDLFSALENPSEYLRTYLGELNDEALTSIRYFYAPAAEFDGYELYSINLGKDSICYYYLPPNTRLLGNSDKLIQVTYQYNLNLLQGAGPLDSVCEQLELSLTEDGLLYDKQGNLICFAVENDRMIIQVPDHMNTYEQLKPLCVATKYTVGNAQSSLLTES